jgi:GntR family transcriptional regulator
VSSPVLPSYLRIAEHIRARIASGELEPHTMVPSERRLSEEFEVSRMTARQALALLEREGWVYRSRPRGTFVAEPRIPLRVGSFTSEIARTGRRPGAQLLHAVVEAPESSVAAALGLAADAKVHALERLRTADGEPLAIERTWFPVSVCPDLLDGPLDGSLWAVLQEKSGIVPSRAAASIEAVALDSISAQRLRARDKEPGILLTRRTFDVEGRPFEFARDLYRGDRAELYVDTAIQSDEPLSEPSLLLDVRPGLEP